MSEIRERIAGGVDRVIDCALELERIVGAVLVIAVDGDVIYERAAGLADREARIPVRHDTVFRLASAGKIIVATAALAMVERGILSLEDPVTRWLPGFRPKLDSGVEPLITVRHLMTHTAGLDYGFLPGDGPYQRAGVSSGLDMPGLSLAEQIARLASVPLLGEPGSKWTYSLATDVLGAVLGSAAQAALPQVVAYFVTGPLGMRDTDFQVGPDRIDRLAVPYADGLPRPVRMSDPYEMVCQFGVLRFSPSRILDPDSYPSAGAGMAATARDLLTLLEAIRRGGHPILGNESAVALTRDALPLHMTTISPGWTHGLGAGVLRDRRIAGVPHENGTWRWGGAYGNDWFVDPHWGLTVVSLTNTALEGSDGCYPRNLRDAVYYGLTAVA